MLYKEQEWIQEARTSVSNFPKSIKELREACLGSLKFFARYINPGYMYGSVHDEVFDWFEDYILYEETDENITSNKLLLLSRAHLKSHVAAVSTSWLITRHPEVTVLYLSATSDLAKQQLSFIKQMMSSDKYLRLFPEYIHPNEHNRKQWTSEKITIDHYKRVEEGVRDSTIATAGLTTGTTGWHADIIICDDLVTPDNAYTQDGRDSVKKKAAQLTSIRNPGGFTIAVGTRYHPDDIYNDWKNQEVVDYSDEGDLLGTYKAWEVIEKPVEVDGLFTWPRSIREDGKAYGFNWKILARIKSEYGADPTQFYAQYYNNPNAVGSERVSADRFQYFNPARLTKEGNVWKYGNNRLNIYAAIDFAFSYEKIADYTAITVVGIDCDKRRFVLDLCRFKSDKTQDYFRNIRDLHSKWNFNKLRAEVTQAQQTIVTTLKEYIKRDGLFLSIDEFRPSRRDGSKEERIAAVVEPLYDAQLVWHCEGGLTNILEEELKQSRPQHDDLKDSLAAAFSICVAPAKPSTSQNVYVLNSIFKKHRFGGYRA